MTLTVVVLSITGRDASCRAVGFRGPLALGSALIACGLVWATVVGDGHAPSRPAWVVVGTSSAGVGIGLCYPLLGAATVAGLPHRQLAAASALNQCARQLGAALGVAGTVAAIGTQGTGAAHAFHVAWAVCAGFALTAAALAAALPSTRDG